MRREKKDPEWDAKWEKLQRDKTPLSPAERYLWHKLEQFPGRDWRAGDPKDPDHLYYLHGWEMVNHIQELLFQSSSAFGLRWPHRICGLPSTRPLFNQPCSHDGCLEVADSLLRFKSTGPGEDDWEQVPNAPLFFCYPHHREEIDGSNMFHQHKKKTPG